MPENIFLLLPLIGGYIFASQWNKTKWYAARWEKERLLLNSTLWGMLFFAVAALIVTAQDYLPCVSRFPCLPRWPLHMGEFKYLGVSLLALFIGSLAWIPANRVWRNIEDRIIQNEGTLFDIVTNDSMKRRKTVLLTLKSGKVYAGFVTSAPSPGHSRPMIRILPTISGYRDRKTHRVVFTTNYSEALERIYDDCSTMASEAYEKRQRIEELQTEINKASDPRKEQEEELFILKTQAGLLEADLKTLASSVEDFGILIPVEEIASMSLYHADIHAKYFAPLAKAPPKKHQR